MIGYLSYNTVVSSRRVLQLCFMEEIYVKPPVYLSMQTWEHLH